MATGDVEVRNWFSNARSALGEHYGALFPAQKAYVNAFIFYGLYLSTKPFGWEISEGFLYFALFSWGMALTSDLLSFYGRLADAALGKLLLLVVVGGGANIAIALSAQVVNEITGVDPSKFVHTIAFISVFTAVVLIHIALSVLFVLGLGIGFIYLVVHWTGDDRPIAMLFPWYQSGDSVPHKRLTVTVRVVSFMAVCWFAYSWAADGQTGYKAFVDDKARWFLYTFEMFGNAPCQLLDSQRLAFLGDGQVLVGEKGGEGISFKAQQCVVGE